MHYINLETWSRRKHFEFFKNFGYPHFSLCANVDITTIYPLIKQQKLSFNLTIVYLLARIANEIPEFRYRIRENKVVEHEVVHPAITILPDESDLFSFCTFNYFQDFVAFSNDATKKIAYAKAHPTLENEEEKDNLLYMSAIPWVSFTNFMHPLRLYPTDSIPRFAWGKFFKDGELLKMPLNVQAHHALMDGLHIGRFYEKVDYYLSDPDLILG